MVGFSKVKVYLLLEICYYLRNDAVFYILEGERNIKESKVEERESEDKEEERHNKEGEEEDEEKDSKAGERREKL